MILIRGTDAKWQYDTHHFPPANCTLLRSVAVSESRCFSTLTDHERSWFHYMKENKFLLSSRRVKVGSNSAAGEAAKLVCNNPAFGFRTGWVVKSIASGLYIIFILSQMRWVAPAQKASDGLNKFHTHTAWEESDLLAWWVNSLRSG